MPLCYPSPLWHRGGTGAPEGSGFRASSGCLTLPKSHRAQCVEGMFLTPALPLNCMIFLRNKNNNSNKSPMGVVQAWQKMGSSIMKPVF